MDVVESYKFGYWGKTSEEILKNQFPLHRCCRDGDVEGLSMLLAERSYAIHTEDSFYGWTPAHWAAYFGNLACLRKLLMDDMKSHVATSRFGQTPAHIAAYGGHPSLLQWLVQAGINVEDKDYLGETPLHKAARTGSIECVSLLVTHGANLRVLNNNLHTPAQLAKSCGYYECARYLADMLSHNPPNPTDTNDVNDCAMDCGDGHPIAGHTNGVQSPSNDDILLVEGVSRNSVPVAGRKRTLEDAGDGDSKRRRPNDGEFGFPNGFPTRNGSGDDATFNHGPTSGWLGMGHLSFSGGPITNGLVNHTEAFNSSMSANGGTGSDNNGAAPIGCESNSMVDHRSQVLHQQGYDSLMADAMVHHYHGS